MKLKLLIALCAEKFHYYVVLSKAILFISGLIFSYKLVNLALFSILITHLSEWKSYTLPKAVSIVSLQEGTYAVSQIFFAFLADAYTGHFNMMLCSTPFYIIGLLQCCVAARDKLISLFFAGLVMVTFSQAALKVTLEAFLDDQLLATTTTVEEAERAISRSKFWQIFVALLAAVVSVVGVSTIRSFVTLTMVLAAIMGAAFCWFLLGIRLYFQARPRGSGTLGDIVQVIFTAAVTKRNVEYPQIPDQLHENWGGLVQIPPHVPWLRCLDRAAVLVPQNQIEKRSINNTCTVKQVKGVKFLLKMLPMWATFLTFSLVSASGSTFFLEEATYIDESIPILLFIFLQRFTRSTVAYISDYTLEKLEEKKNMGHQQMMLVRIGIGMLCCVLCCIAAWIQTHYYTTVFGLIPQYILLGVMEGLSEDGLENFFGSQVSKSRVRYGPPFDECVQGIGKFLSVICILILTKWFAWFGDDISSSYLNRYYAMLAILSSVNVVIYCFVAYWYGDDKFLEDNDNCDQVDVEMAINNILENNIEALVSQSLYHNGQNTSPSEEVDSQLPLLNMGTFQETESSSRAYERDDHAMETLKPDVVADSEYQVHPLMSGARSFSRPSSRGINRRFYSMR